MLGLVDALDLVHLGKICRRLWQGSELVSFLYVMILLGSLLTRSGGRHFMIHKKIKCREFPCISPF